MNSRRFLSAVMTATVVAAFAAPTVQAAGSEDQMPVMPMPQNRNLGHMIERMEDQKADHIAGEMADPMAAKQTALPDHVALPASPYEQSAQGLTPTELCKRYERRFDTAVVSHAQAARVDEARTLRIEGGKLCAGSEQSRGIHKLREALGYLGTDAAPE